MTVRTELRNLRADLQNDPPSRIVVWSQDPCGGDAFTSRTEPGTLTDAELDAWCAANPTVQPIIVRRVSAADLRRDDA